MWLDLRYGWRAMWARPGFTVLAMLTLALGIGANSTIFSFVNGVLLRPLPYESPEQLVLINETALKRGIPQMGVSFPNFVDWREQNTVFTGVAAFSGGGYTLAAEGEPERVAGGGVAHGLFETLGVSPILGRTFTPDEDQPDHDTVVILGHGLWQRQFSGDPGVLGRELTLNGRTRTVIGVMSAGFKFPEVAELWVPLALDEKRWTRTDHGLGTIARLKPGVTLAQARAEMDLIAKRIEAKHPITNEGMGVMLTELREGLAGNYRQALFVLLGVVGFVLLISCVNVANLLLARATARQREIAIRVSLGAGPRRIFRQLLTEAVLLAVAGGMLGLAFTWWGLDLLLAAIPDELPFWMKITLDGRVLGFTAGIVLLTGVIFGLAPALQFSRPDFAEALKEGGRGMESGGRSRLRSLLVVAEVALALVLLVGAGLMMRSFLSLQRVDPGLRPEGLLTAQVSLAQSRYREPVRRAAFFRELLTGLRALPGVESASAISNLPLSGSSWGRSLTVEGRPVLSVGQAPMINHCVISTDYFRAMGIPLLAGRDFTEADADGATRVTIINETLAREFFSNEDPLGKRIRFGPPENNEPWHTIVGVAKDVRHDRLEAVARRGIYVPHAQIPVGGLTLVLRAGVEPTSLVAEVRSKVRELDRQIPLTNVRTMEQVVARSVWQPRLYTALFGVFAVVALILAAGGIYGVISYGVAQRTHEIGIRMALGARPRDVLGLVVRQGMLPALAGIGLGIGGALALTRLMASLLYSIGAHDPATFAGVALLLALVALLACYLPARRATKVDPVVALRDQ